MIQEINPRTMFNQYDVREPEEGSYVVFVRKNKLLCKLQEDELVMPAYGEIRPGDCRYICRVDDDLFFSSWDEASISVLESAGYEFHSANELRTTHPDWLKFGALTAFSYAGWYDKNRYCGRCGSYMKHSDTERAMICPDCGNTVYPKICPVVIVGVIHEDTILLTKYKDKMRFDRYALIAGFAEIGESIEQTVTREVLEETGIKVKNLKFYKSQPWAFSDSLLMGFFCELDGGDETVRLDTNELKEGLWLRREELPERSGEASLTAEMMEMFRTGREG